MNKNAQQLDIIIGADHAGFFLKEKVKEYLINTSYQVYDAGTYDGTTSVDYPVVAYDVAEKVAQGKYLCGILICGSGIGVAITANKVKGIRAATCHETYSARMSRLHNNANILTMGARIIAPELAFEIVSTWLSTEFAEGRHRDRINLIESFELC